MYHEYSQEELRSYCKTCIETLEIWARRLIHEKMVEVHGIHYIEKTLENGNYLVKKEIREHIQEMMEREPDRFSRPIDTLYISQITYFLTNRNWYNELFKEALDYMYPQGSDEVREFLNRLVPIRNALSHATPISIRQAEQAICYSHDFIDGLKKYYVAKGEEQVWNVPRIIKVQDSKGNVFDNIIENSGLGARLEVPQPLNCGETYSVEIEMDSSFDKNEYTIKWEMLNRNTKKYENSTKFVVQFMPIDVSTLRVIECRIISKKDWHKFGLHDSRIALSFTVLPPIE